MKVDLYFKFDFYRKIMGGLTMEILMQSENLLLGVNLDSKKSGESEKNKKKQRKTSYWDKLSKSKYIAKIEEHTPESKDETDISSKAMYNSTNVIQ